MRPSRPPTNPILVRSCTASSCIGLGVTQTLESLLAGRSGLKACEFESVAIDTCVGEVPGVDGVALPGELAKFDCRNNRLAELALRQDGFLEDIERAARRWDPRRIGVMGWSYGGYMTLQCLLHAPEIFKAGAAGAPVTNWLNYDTIYTERYMGLPQDNPNGYRDSSPVNFAANLKGRLLLIHNIEDDNVLFANSLQMMNALQNEGQSYDFLLYPQKSHGLGGKARQHLNAQYLRFFDDALK